MMTPVQHLLNHMKTLAEASEHRIHEWEGGIAIDAGTVGPGNHYIINTEVFSQTDMGFISYFFDSEAPILWLQGTETNPVLRQLSNMGFVPTEKMMGLQLDLDVVENQEINKITLKKVERKAGFDQWCDYFSEVWSHDVDQTGAFFQGGNQSPGLNFYLAYVNEKVVGGCCLDLSDGNAGFYWDYILPKHRKKGYGSEMIRWRLTEAKKLGAQTAFAQCSPSSFGIYTALGFQVTQPMSVFKRSI